MNIVRYFIHIAKDLYIQVGQKVFLELLFGKLNCYVF